MPTKKLTKTVHDGEPTRADMVNTDTWMAPATPRGPRRTDREERIVHAHARGADLESLTRNYHTPPAVLFKLLGMNPAEHVETYRKLLDEFNSLNAKALR